MAQQCWIRLHCSSNIVGATHAHYTWSPRSYRAYPSHDTLQVSTLLGVVASVCTPLPTRTQQLPTLLGQQCWELFVPLHVGLHCYAGWEPVNCWKVFPNQKRRLQLQAVMGDSKGSLQYYWTHADSSSPTDKGCVNGKETFEKRKNKQINNNNNNVRMLDVRPLSALTTTLNFLSEIYSFLSSLIVGKKQGNNEKKNKRFLKWLHSNLKESSSFHFLNFLLFIILGSVLKTPFWRLKVIWQQH